ncbi:MAG: DMT family transporter [Acidobacteriota bacterium]
MNRGSAPAPYLLWSLVLIAIASISLASILIRIAEAPSLAIAAYRVTIAALIIAPYRLFRKNQGAAPDRRTVAASILSGVFLALHFITWIQSLQMTSVASSATLVSTTPLFVALTSVLWLGEKTSRALWAGIGCTLLGSALVAGTDFSFSPRALAGDLLALCGALMATGYLIAGRYARRHMDLPTYTLVAYGSAAIFLVTCSLATGTPLSGFTEKTYLALVLLAAIPQLIGHTTFNWALKFLSPATVAALILGEPIGATILAYLFLGETVPQMKALGLLVLCTGIVLSSRTEPHACGRED